MPKFVSLLLFLTATTFAGNAVADCLAPGRWEFTDCRHSWGGSSGDSFGAAIAALGLLSSIANSIQEEQHARAVAAHNAAVAAAIERENERIRVRNAYCQETWRRGANANQAGLELMISFKPQEAIVFFETAISHFQACSDNRNIEISKVNLRVAERKSAAIRDDNRVEDSSRSFSKFDAYSTDRNPFGVTKSEASKTSPADIVSAAHKNCNASAQPGTPAWTNCVQASEARSILNSDSEINKQCSIFKNSTARNECALKAYASKVNQGIANPSGSENCAWDEAGRLCYPGGVMVGKAPSVKRIEPDIPVEPSRPDAVPILPADSATSTGYMTGDVPKGTDGGDGAWSNYMQHTNKDGGQNNGDLGSGSGVFLGLEPSPETRVEMNQILNGGAP